MKKEVSTTDWSLAELEEMTPNELEFGTEGLADLQRKVDAERAASRRK